MNLPDVSSSDDEQTELRALQDTMRMGADIPRRERPQQPKIYQLVEAVDQDLNASPLAFSDIIEAVKRHVQSAKDATLTLADTSLFRSRVLPFLEASLLSVHLSPDQTFQVWETTLYLALLPPDPTSYGIIDFRELEATDRRLDNLLVDIMLLLYRHRMFESVASDWEVILDRFRIEAAQRRLRDIRGSLARSIQFLEAREYRRVLRRKVSVALSGTLLPIELRELVGDHLILLYGLDAPADAMDRRWHSIEDSQWSLCAQPQAIGSSGCGDYSCPRIAKVRWHFRRRRWLVTHGKHVAIHCSLGRHCTGHHDHSLAVLL